MRLFFLLFLFASKAFSMEDCEGLFNGSDAEWRLPQGKRRLLISMLVKTPEKKLILASGDYFFGTHVEMYRNLARVFKISKVLWAGEILMYTPGEPDAYISL